MNIREVAKIIFINIVVLFALLFLLVITPAIIGSVHTVIREIRHPVEDGLKLVYRDRQVLIQPLAEESKLSLLYKDYIVWRRGQHSGENINISNDGIRKSLGQVSGVFKGGEYIFLGGSTIYGYGVNDQNTIPSQFHSLTNRSVLNLGETGYIARQSLSMLENFFISKETPRGGLVIISYDGANDVSHRCRSEINGLETGYQSLIQESLNNRVARDNYFSVGYIILPWVKLIQKIMQSDSTSVSPQSFDCSSDPEKAKMVADTLVRTWRQMHAISSAHGYRFIASLQPLAVYGSPNLTYKITDTDKVIQDQVKAVYPLVLNGVKGQPFEFIDLSRALDGPSGNAYYDFCHLDPQGNRLIAQFFVKKLGLNAQSKSTEAMK